MTWSYFLENISLNQAIMRPSWWLLWLFYNDYLGIHLDNENKQLIRHNLCLLMYFLVHTDVGKNIWRMFTYKATSLVIFQWSELFRWFSVDFLRCFYIYSETTVGRGFLPSHWWRLPALPNPLFFKFWPCPTLPHTQIPPYFFIVLFLWLNV